MKHLSGQKMANQIYPQYHQYTTSYFSYLFKFENSSSLTLKISSANQKNIGKYSLSNENLGEKYINRISREEDLSIVLEYLVEIGTLSRELFPVPTRIEKVQQLIQSKDWLNAEKEALEGLYQGNKAEKAQYYKLLEEVYNDSNPEKIEELWNAQGEAYMEASQLAEAEKIYQKAFKRFKNFVALFGLANIFNRQGEVKRSVQTYFDALEIALLGGEFENVSLCIQSIQHIDPKMEELDSNQKFQILIQSQLLEISTKLQSQQRNLFRFLSIILDSRHKTLLNSLLHNAVVQNDSDIVKMIMEHFELIDINASDEPPIITAARAGHKETVEALLTHPCINIDCKGRQGTALSIAEQEKHKSIVDILYNHSKALEKELVAFKNKPLGVTQHLHIHIYQGHSGQQCLIFIGIDRKGKKSLLDISSKRNQTWQDHLKYLESRGLKDFKFITTVSSASSQSRRSNQAQASSLLFKVPVYSEGEEIRAQLGEDVAKAYKEASERVAHLIKLTSSEPLCEKVIYRAIKLIGKDYCPI